MKLLALNLSINLLRFRQDRIQVGGISHQISVPNNTDTLMLNLAKSWGEGGLDINEKVDKDE